MRTRLHLGCAKRREGEALAQLWPVYRKQPGIWLKRLKRRFNPFVQVLILQGQKHVVSFLCPSPDGVHIAVGYEDGAVKIFNLLNGESSVSFNGHKSAVTAISYDALGARLVTGSKVQNAGFS